MSDILLIVPQVSGEMRGFERNRHLQKQTRPVHPGSLQAQIEGKGGSGGSKRAKL
jgi:hypothetical protein